MTDTEFYEDIRIVGRRPLTANAVMRQQRAPVRVATRWWRQEAAEAWTRKDNRPVEPPVIVTGQPLHATKASPQDAGACLPAVKAALDGIVDAGGLPDDTPEYVAGLLLLAPIRDCGFDGLIIRVSNVDVTLRLGA